jgi:toxin ParE1/3/4
MATELLWTPQAEADLLDIYSFVAIDNRAAADRILDRVESDIQILTRNPRLCQRRPDIHPSMRIFVEHPYLILYQTHPDTDEGAVTAVEIVRIVDGRRNLKDIL